MDSIVDMVRRARAGDPAELDRLFTALYDEIRRIAHNHLRHRTPGQTIDTTALIHEAYLRMVDQTGAEWIDRVQFFGYASRAMRTVLVDYARQRNAAKRGGGRVHFSLDDRDLPIEAQSEFVVALDEALSRLTVLDERLGRTVECRYFAGMTDEETATALGISDRTVRRNWLKAKAWLRVELSDPPRD
jgi:RNA polymerase sigma factor (TIGR02999 family)